MWSWAHSRDLNTPRSLSFEIINYLRENEEEHKLFSIFQQQPYKQMKRIRKMYICIIHVPKNPQFFNRKQ